jgi:hypothetical protein
MRRRNILIGTLAVAVVVAAIGVVAYALYTDEAPYPGLNAPVAVVCPGPPTYSTTDQGFPAIRPRNDCTPSFTQQDVRDYLANGVNHGAIRTSHDSPPAVTRVVFLTMSDLARASGEGPGDTEWETNYPPDMLVCYAGLRDVSVLCGDLCGAFHYERASIVFDAHTGNQLVLVFVAPLG